MDVSEVYYPARHDRGQDVLSPGQRPIDGSFHEVRRPAVRQPEHEERRPASDALGGVCSNKTTNAQEDTREVSKFCHPSGSGKEHYPTREQRRHCSNFSSEERTPDLQALYVSFDSAHNSADFETTLPEEAVNEHRSANNTEDMEEMNNDI